LGTWYDSLSVHGASVERVRDRLDEWALLRGFVRIAEPLFACDDEDMGFYLASNGRWVVILPSRDGELAQLVRRLEPLDRPMLRVACAGGDAWGYQLIEGGAPTVEFFPPAGGFTRDDELCDEPPTDPRKGDPTRLCRVLEMPGREPEVRTIHAWKPLFRDRAAQRFCVLLGAEAAASSHRYAEDRELDGLAGWTLEHVVYAPERDDSTFDLHSATAWPTPRPRGAPDEARDAEREAMREAMQRQMRTTLIVMRVVTFPLSIAFKMLAVATWLVPKSWKRALLRRAIAGAGGGSLPSEVSSETADDRPPPTWRVADGWLMEDRHGARVRLPEGAVARDPIVTHHLFAIERDGTRVSIGAMRFEALRALGAGAEMLEDECLHVGRLKARRRVLRHPPSKRAKAPHEPAPQTHVVVQGPRAIYHFMIAGAETPAARELMMELVGTFEIDATGATPPAPSSPVSSR